MIRPIGGEHGRFASMNERVHQLAVVGFYGALTGIAVCWTWLRGARVEDLLAPGTSSGWGIGDLLASGTSSGWGIEFALGMGVGLAVVVAGRLGHRLFAPIRRLSSEIRELLPRLKTWDVVLMAVTSGIGEELLFRGAMQSAWGFWPTVILFSVVHGFFIRRYWAWMAFAAVAGVLFGWMVLATGTLLAPILAHATINGLNLAWLERTRPGTEHHG